MKNILSLFFVLLMVGSCGGGGGGGGGEKAGDSAGGTDTATPTGTGTPTATNISWTAPTRNFWGDDLAQGIQLGYKIHIGTSTGTYTTTVDLQQVTTKALAELSLDPGTYYVALTAYDDQGQESIPSEEVTVTYQ